MRSTAKHRFAAGAVLALLVSVAASERAARADDDLEAMLAQNVVTTASQTAETTATAPATTSVITAEEIREHGIRTVNEAMNYLSLGFFATSPAHGVEVGARGVQLPADYGNHVLLLIDGHAVNEPYGGVASFDRGLGVPIELVDHIELILGPGAVLYGSNAMLGVVNVVTKRAKDYRGLHVVADADIGTWGKVGAGAGGTITLLGRPVELTAALEMQHQDGPQLHFAPQPYGLDAVTGQPKRFSPDGPATGVWGGTIKREYFSNAPSVYARAVSGNLDLSLRASTFQRASPYIDNLINLSGDFDAPGVYELERFFFADLKYRIPVSKTLELRLRAYGDLYTYDWYNRSSAAEDCPEGQVDGCHKDLRANSHWVGTEARATFDWLQTNQLVTMVGLDVRKEWVTAELVADPTGAGERATSSHVDVSNVRLGVYGQQTAQPTSWLFLNGGARLDVAEGYPGAVSPRAVVGVVPWKGGTFKGIFSQAFRAPSSYERGFEDVNTLRADRLKPEHESSFEASFEQQLGAHRLMFGAFDTDWRDLVVFEQISADQVESAIEHGAHLTGDVILQYRNADTIENTGFNAGVEGSFLTRRLRYGATVTGAVSRRGSSDGSTPQPIPIAPSIYGNGRLSYDLGGQLPTVALAGYWQGRTPADGYFEPRPYAPPVLHLRAVVSGPVPVLTGLSYRVLASYAFEPTGAYTVGPVQTNGYGVGAALNPIDQFQLGVGLQYAWAP
ncbi:MAG: hypothetical protein JWP97_4908 [Labilithrix sp.]|nr:hypothetical protein [Labilithrix sp.]